MTATITAPTFQVTHRTIAGQASDPIDRVKDDTWVTATATITTARVHGTGASTRITLGLTADNGSIAVATIDATRVQQIPDFLRSPRARVEVRGTVRRLPGMPIVIEVTGIAPAA